jgi:hypothetical protein
MDDTDFPIADVVMMIGLAVLLGATAISIFRTSAPDAGTSPSVQPPKQANEAPSLPEGIAALLYVVGVLLLLAGGLIFAFADTSIHEILATLIGLMGAIFFAAGAVVTELQRIKKQLQADAMRLAANNPQP